MRKIAIFLLSIFFCSIASASDYHQRGQRHRVVYTVTDENGNPVSGQTVRLKIQRVSDDAVYDFSNYAFTTGTPTTPLYTMIYNATGEYYAFTFSQDAARFNSGDYVCIVSNDSALYGDQQAEVVEFSTEQDVIRINR